MTAPMIAQFDGLNLSIIDHAGKKWLTSEQVGLALGYKPEHARSGISKIYNRHADEFTEQDTGVIKLTTPFEDKTSSNPQGGNPTTRIFSVTGCSLLSFFSNTTKAKEFRAWAKQVLAEKLQAAPVVLNRPGKKLLVTRRLERQVLELFVQGFRQKEIARETGLSVATVNLLLHAKYQFSPAAGRPECPADLLEAVANRHFEIEQERLIDAQQRLAQRLCHHSHNKALAEQLNRVGQHLQQQPAQALLPAEAQEG